MKGDGSGRALSEGDVDGDGGATVREVEAANEGVWVEDVKLENVDRGGSSRIIDFEAVAEAEIDVSRSERFEAMEGRRGVVVVGARLTWLVMSSGTDEGVTLSIRVKDGRRSTVVGADGDRSCSWFAGIGMLEADSISFCITLSVCLKE